jgi:hypothetical protein
MDASLVSSVYQPELSDAAACSSTLERLQAAPSGWPFIWSIAASRCSSLIEMNGIIPVMNDASTSATDCAPTGGTSALQAY